MLVLHIGTHKTGTTSLQAFCDANVDLLRARGVRYIAAGRPGRRAHHVLAWSIRGRRGADISAWDGVRAEIADNPGTIDVLSSEGFWFEDPARVRELLGYDGEVRIVVYLRRQDQYLQSLFKQAVAGGGRVGDFWTWLGEMSRRGDFVSVLDKWAEAFGADAITVRPYERDGQTIDAVDDFLSVLGIDGKTLPEARRERHNPSPRRELLHFLRAFNQLNLKIDPDKLFFGLIKRNKAYVRTLDLLTYEQRRDLLARYAEGNREIEKRYWRQDVPLFSELTPSDLPQIWTPDDPEYFQLTVDVLEVVVKLISGEVEIERRKDSNWKAP